MRKYSFTIKGNNVFEYKGTTLPRDHYDPMSLIFAIIEIELILADLGKSTIEQLRVVSIEEIN